MSRKEFDVFIIGSGTAAQTAASELFESGLSIGMIDRQPYGGTCALRGCQPKKYLVVPAHAALEGAGLTARGFRAAPELDWALMQRSRAEFTDELPASTREWLESKGVETLSGRCRFVSTDTLLCESENSCESGAVGRAYTIQARQILIATGSRPRPLDIPGGDICITSDEFLYMKELPKRIVFVGGGYISMEFAHVAAACGSEATVLHRSGRILKGFDPDMVTIVEEAGAERGIHVRKSCAPEAIEGSEINGYTVRLPGGERLTCDLVVAAIGRIPNVEDLELDIAGVEYGAKGIRVDVHTQTSAPHTYAAGDCVDSMQLAPVADTEGRTAARNIEAAIKGTAGAEVDRNGIPSVVFTYPQLASVGVSAEETGTEDRYRVIESDGSKWPDYKRLNERFVRQKIILDNNGEYVVGAHLAGPKAADMINLFALAIRNRIPVTEMKELPWAYPTYTADIKYMLE